jgi:hypothetical protein
MIKIENVVTPSAAQWEAIIRGTRNPFNSWAKSDSKTVEYVIKEREPVPGVKVGEWEPCVPFIDIGSNDYDLMMRLRNAGTDHRKFMRTIVIYVDITAPLYWWKEMDTYSVGKVQNSCSTMHTIHKKEFELDDFSHERLLGYTDLSPECPVPIMDLSDEGDWSNVFSPYGILRLTVNMLNLCRDRYLEVKDTDKEFAKRVWDSMIQLLPTSYNQKRTVMMNYEVLANIYKSRKHHKLDEWKELCTWIETLPYSELITGGTKDE